MIRNQPGRLIINEMFHSIQGESTFAGCPMVFIRLTYCNIRCSYCDTAYAFEEGTEKSIDDIVAEVRRHGARYVEVTGGEPLLQENTPQLLQRLCDEGYQVLLETGGTLSLEGVDPRVRCIVDLKCPSSRMSHKNYWGIIDQLKATDEVKFVIGTREDYEWSKEILDRYRLAERCPVLMSVVFGELEPVQLCEWILADRLNVRFQLQTHKIIWDPRRKGV